MWSIINGRFLQAAKSLSSPLFYHNSRIVYLSVGVSAGLFSTAMAQTGNTSICEFEVKDIDGNTVSLSKYKGFVTVIVNVATK